MRHLYLHVPFCNSICYYCDFKRSIYQEEIVYAWLKSIDKELMSISESQMETIYIGGGTPTALNEKQLSHLLTMLDRFTDVNEYTIESNIESLSFSKVKIMLEHGVNRISLGVQSLQDSLLQMMNRKHTAADVFHKIEQLHEWGIHNISCDFIYGFHNQTKFMWEQDLIKICTCPYVNHLSHYSLTIEENSVFGKRKQQKCDSEIEAWMYERAIQILTANGFHQYEVANFARGEKESCHNKGYWHYDDFYGIGLGASGKKGNVRYENCGTIHEYLQGKHQVVKEELSIEDRMFENIMMSLRLKEGMSITCFNTRYHCDFKEYYKEPLQKNIEKKWLEIKGDYVRTTNQGMLFLHDILIDFL